MIIDILQHSSIKLKAKLAFEVSFIFLLTLNDFSIRYNKKPNNVYNR